MNKMPIKKQIAAIREQRDVLRTSYRSPLTGKMNDTDAIETVSALNAALATMNAHVALVSDILAHDPNIIGAREWSKIFNRAKSTAKKAKAGS